MNLLEAYPLYKNFSNKSWIPNSPGRYDSLESLHDQIHGLVGTNGGHMAYVSKALFQLGLGVTSPLNFRITTEGCLLTHQIARIFGV